MTTQDTKTLETFTTQLRTGVKMEDLVLFLAKQKQTEKVNRAYDILFHANLTVIYEGGGLNALISALNKANTDFSTQTIIFGDHKNQLFLRQKRQWIATSNRIGSICVHLHNKNNELRGKEISWN
jgi:hypothetical protein